MVPKNSGDGFAHKLKIKRPLAAFDWHRICFLQKAFKTSLM